MSTIVDDTTNINNDNILTQNLSDASQIDDDNQNLSSTQEKQSDWHKNRSNIDDVPQLEYDEHDIQLIADREVEDDDDELEYDNNQLHFNTHHDDIGNGVSSSIPGENSQNRGIIKGHITSDGIIDDDFETELGGNATPEFHDTEDPDYYLMKKISEYGIVELCGEDKFGRKVIVCSACRLPHENAIRNSDFQTVERFYDCLLKYILKTFDRYVDMDYVVIYFHHGLHSYNRPSYGWLISAYRHIDRKYKKNLKALYVVHPTTWIKFLWPLLRSLISSKFSSKLIYVNRLGQLTEYVHLENIKIPIEVRTYDPVIPKEIPPVEIKPTMKFHVSLQFILTHEPGEKIPLVVRQTAEFIKNYGLNELGIFRRSASVLLIKSIQDKYNNGQPVVFEQYGDVHVAACVLKTFLRDLTEPIMTFRLYPELIGLSALRRQNQIEVLRDIVMEKLPVENYNVLKYLIELLNLISVYSDTNLMTPTNLSIVFGPNLAWSDDVQMNTLVNISLINTFTEILITRYTEIFLK